MFSNQPSLPPLPIMKGVEWILTRGTAENKNIIEVKCQTATSEVMQCNIDNTTMYLHGFGSSFWHFRSFPRDACLHMIWGLIFPVSCSRLLKKKFPFSVLSPIFTGNIWFPDFMSYKWFWVKFEISGDIMPINLHKLFTSESHLNWRWSIYTIWTVIMGATKIGVKM